MSVREQILNTPKEELIIALNNSYNLTDMLKTMHLPLEGRNRMWLIYRLDQEQIDYSGKMQKQPRTSPIWITTRDQLVEIISSSRTATQALAKLGMSNKHDSVVAYWQTIQRIRQNRK